MALSATSRTNCDGDVTAWSPTALMMSPGRRPARYADDSRFMRVTTTPLVSGARSSSASRVVSGDTST